MDGSFKMIHLGCQQRFWNFGFGFCFEVGTHCIALANMELTKQSSETTGVSLYA